MSSKFSGWTIKNTSEGPIKKSGIKKTKKKKDDKKERLILSSLNHAGFNPERNYIFHPTRHWKFDLALPDHRIAIEYEGGIYSNGGHNRGPIYADNCIKYREAALLGWIVLRYTCDDIDCKKIYSKPNVKGKKTLLWQCQGTKGIVNDVKLLISKLT